MNLEIRLPQQERSREAWERVLEAGARIIAESGSEGFTIAAVCEAAEVAPRFIYDRVNDKETLFLASYDRGIQQVVSEQEVLVDAAKTGNKTAKQRIEFAVHEIGQRFRLHHDFLRNVVLISSANEKIAERGFLAKSGFSAQFVSSLQVILKDVVHDDEIGSLEICFDLIFSAWVVRTAYGSNFSSPNLSDEQFDESLQSVAVKYLLG
jgi:AcrR family transcriptional regulator